MIAYRRNKTEGIIRGNFRGSTNAILGSVSIAAHRWGHLNLTVQEGIDQLATLCSQEVLIHGKPQCHKIPQPDEAIKRLLDAAGVRLPDALPNKGVRVTTKKKLQKRRTSA